MKQILTDQVARFKPVREVGQTSGNIAQFGDESSLIAWISSPVAHLQNLADVSTSWRARPRVEKPIQPIQPIFEIPISFKAGISPVISFPRLFSKRRWRDVAAA